MLNSFQEFLHGPIVLKTLLLYLVLIICSDLSSVTLLGRVTVFECLSMLVFNPALRLP